MSQSYLFWLQTSNLQFVYKRVFVIQSSSWKVGRHTTGYIAELEHRRCGHTFIRTIVFAPVLQPVSTHYYSRFSYVNYL